MLKDPYQFDFLTLRQAAHERDVERALIARVKDLLLELGKGFIPLFLCSTRSAARTNGRQPPTFWTVSSARCTWTPR